jgi:uncharacterized protein YfiM (DUF2279 family)
VPIKKNWGLKIFDLKSSMHLFLFGLAMFMTIAEPAWAQNTAPAADADKWSGGDKPLHFGLSATLGLSARTIFPQEPWKAVGVSMMPGMLKELSDRRFSKKDLAADFAGAMFGVYVGGCYAQHNLIICGFEF